MEIRGREGPQRRLYTKKCVNFREVCQIEFLLVQQPAAKAISEGPVETPSQEAEQVQAVVEENAQAVKETKDVPALVDAPDDDDNDDEEEPTEIDGSIASRTEVDI